ncbi:Co2+/Mg2+ efflux protein ApaG [Aureibacter tunicatorum]|uniref:ApaG protein n=1 Tax=Aureibacter tunicatorum TaxID=866807 RepID=A0AAE3XNN6_9BACT|nr:Co2+/Mg2+ efflux protein ApaG [Aureibacter tunicatorum]MDR6239913.1 ApaG protein [Aureibacter tunicatorum]BDD04388.1 protein ApaG [Aureibacter tunicatorum]
MVTEVTNGIRVSVRQKYQPDYSNPFQAHYVFTYKISIENLTDYTIQLKSRVWNIHDGNGSYREVVGEGVVGQQPVLEPGESHDYVSGCNFKSGIGKMYGKYMFEKIMTGEEFEVNIPEFTLCVPFKLN